MPQFMQWLHDFGKSYPNHDVFDMRFKNFQINVRAMQEFEIARNALKDIGEEISEHEIELNRFADWSQEEYLSILGFKFD